MTKIKNEFLKYEYHDEEYIKRFSIYSDIDFFINKLISIIKYIKIIK